MQKLKMIGLIVLVVVVTFVSAVLIQTMTARREYENRAPMTMKELDEWATARGLAQPSTSLPLSSLTGATKGTAVATVESSNGGNTVASHESNLAVPEDDSTATPPVSAKLPRIQRALTQQEREQQMAGIRACAWLKTRLLPVPLEFAATAYLSFGGSREEGADLYAAAANQAWGSGEWEMAERLYGQSLDYPPGMRFEEAWVRFAYMEDDPELATRMLEIADLDEQSWPHVIGDAAQLAHTTRSRELFEHYLELMETADPQWANQLRSWKWPPRND